MAFANTKLKKTVLIIVISIVAMAGIGIIIISPLTKYLVEKYDMRYLGRQVKIDWAYVNPFTGFVYLENVRINELNKDTLFLSAKSASGNFALRKMFDNTVEITELRINQPIGFVIQKKRDLNFNDIIERFSPDSSHSGKSVHFSILKLVIIDGEFHYREKIIPIDYFIKKVNIESTGPRWDADTIASAFSFDAGHGTGHVSGDFTINTRSKDYRIATVVRDLDLELIRQYLWELINYGMFRAQLHANLKASGNFLDANRITLKGKLTINDFHLGKTTTEDYTSFSKLAFVVDELSPYNKKYLFDSVTLIDPFVSYERFDSLDNVQALFGKKGSNISDVTQQPGRFNLVIQLTRYIKTLSEKFFASQYRINSLAITNGDIKFSDYSLSEKFSIHANALFLKADSITKKNKRVKFYLRSGIHPYGNLSASLSMNPLDSGDLDLDYNIQKVPATVFNPYIISFTEYPLDKGTLHLNGAWKVRNGIIRSNNNITLIDPRVGRRLKSKETKWLPLPLIMAFVRERGNIIDYKIPITGNLKDPKFHLRDVVLDLFQNIFIKPATFPYGLEVKSTEKEIEGSVALTWKMGQSSLERRQTRFVNKMARFLKDSKEARIDVYPQHYAVKEKEQILFFEAKKKYFLLTTKKNAKDFSYADSIKADKMSIKDLGPFFVKDLTKITRDTTMFTIQDKCNYFVDAKTVNHSYKELVETRENSVRNLFVSNGTSDRLKMHERENIIPYDGFSRLKLTYNGDMPKSLKASYEKMHRLNNKALRKKYFSR